MKYTMPQKLSQVHTQPKIVRDLVARINAGGHERCPGCYGWVESENLGAAAIFVSRAKPREPVAYVLCRSCALKLAHPAERRELVERVEAYLTDGEGVGDERN